MAGLMLRIMAPQNIPGFRHFLPCQMAYHHMTPLVASLHASIRSSFRHVSFAGYVPSIVGVPEKSYRSMEKHFVIRLIPNLSNHPFIWSVHGRAPIDWCLDN